jgi:xanthine dehydrogenase YagT iron-sulfur-binding subunit
MEADITLDVDGTCQHLTVDTRTTLLDALRERLGNMSPKKGCDHGQCGACTVLIGGRRSLACLALAVAHDAAEITTADGLAARDDLHPVQQAFVDHDALQCGYCTPGQVCSAVGMLDEVDDGWASAASPSVATGIASSDEIILDRDEIAERMSGNLCRCGAYANIVPAVRQAAGSSR